MRAEGPSLLGGSGGMFPQKMLQFRSSKTPFSRILGSNFEKIIVI